MTVRRDEYYERLVEHLQEREWSDVQIINLTHKIGHSALMSHEGVLEVLEFQQEVDEGIQAQKDHDRVFVEPTTYIRYEDYQQPSLPYDDMGNWHNPDGWDVT